jgi:hypothetical protein
MALNSFQVKKVLQIASAYGAYKGGELMKLRQAGKNCEAEKTRLKLLYSFIDSIQDYGSIYVNPSTYFSVASLTSGATITLTIDGSVNFPPLTLNTSSAAVAKGLVIDYINSQNLGFTAEAVIIGPLTIKVSAASGSLFNGATFVVTTTGTIGITAPSSTFSSDGDDYFNRYTDRCLEDNQVQTILDRINSFVDVPCEKFVTF